MTEFSLVMSQIRGLNVCSYLSNIISSIQPVLKYFLKKCEVVQHHQQVIHKVFTKQWLKETNNLSPISTLKFSINVLELTVLVKP